VDFWDTRSSTCTRMLDLPSGVVGHPVVFSPSGKRLAGFCDGRMVIWSTDNGKEHQSIPVSGYPQDLAFSCDGQRLVWSEGNQVHVWRMTTENTLPPPTAFPTSRSPRPLFSPHDPDLLAYQLDDQTLVLQTLTSRSQTRHLKIDGQQILCFGFSGDGSMIAAGSGKGVAKVWKTGGWDLEAIFVRSYDKDITSLAFSPDGTRLAVTTASTISILNLGSSISDTTIHRQWRPDLCSIYDTITQVIFSPDGNILASSIGTWSLLWDMEDTQTYPDTNNIKASFTCVVEDSQTDDIEVFDGYEVWQAYTFGIKPFAITKGGNDMRIWDAETGESLHVFDDISPGSMLATSISNHVAVLDTERGVLRVMNAATSQNLSSFNIGQVDEAVALCLSPQGSLLVIFCEDRCLRIWTCAAHASPTEISFDLDSELQHAGISRDASAAVWATKRTINLWKLEGSEVSTAQLDNWEDGKEVGLCAMALWHDPSAVIVGMCNEDGEVMIWEPKNVDNPRPWVIHHLHDCAWRHMLFPEATQILVAGNDDVVTLFQLNPDHSPTTRTSSFALPKGVRLQAISRVNDNSSTYLLTLHGLRDQDQYHGLMAVKMELDLPNPPSLPLCWLPSDIEVTSTSVKDYRVVLCCESGEVLILDISGIQKYGF